MSVRPEADALDALVRQFSERSSFVRELIQNSLDAGAGRIEVLLSGSDESLLIEVVDDGEGMDRDIIERYLLTLFRSSKERDLTKIGKFGVGFVSLFTLEPTLVVVDTGRDGRHHRVVFAADRSYTLAEVDTPFEGTTVRIEVPIQDGKRAKLAQEVRQAVHYWCRYARAEIWTEGDSPEWGWELEEVRYSFSVAGPLQSTHEEDGFRVVMSYTNDDPPLVGYYNRGLTLLQAREPAVPGVTFRVEARVLEHTLTRDNVIRDRNHQAVLKKVDSLAKTTLRSAHIAAIQAAIEDRDAQRHAELLQVAAHADLPGSLPCLRTADGGLACLDDLRPGLLRRLFSQEILHADGPSPLVTALTAAGRIVLSSPPRPEVALAVAHGLGEPVDVHSSWILPALCEPHPLVTAASGGGLELVAADFTERGDAISGQLATWQDEPGSLEQRTVQHLPPRRLGTVLICTAHPIFARLAALPVAIAAPLLRHTALQSLGREGPMSALNLTALLEASP